MKISLSKNFVFPVPRYDSGTVLKTRINDLKICIVFALVFCDSFTHCP